MRPERSAERPHGRPECPTSWLTLEPVPIREVDAVDLGIGLEDLAIARRRENLDDRPRISRAEPGENRCRQDGVAHVVELNDQDLPRGFDAPGRPETSPDRHQDRADGVEQADGDSPSPARIAIAAGGDGFGLSG